MAVNIGVVATVDEFALEGRDPRFGHRIVIGDDLVERVTPVGHQRRLEPAFRVVVARGRGAGPEVAASRNGEFSEAAIEAGWSRGWQIRRQSRSWNDTRPSRR